MGTAKAAELLLLGKKVTAKEAEALGLITEVHPVSTFEAIVWPKLKEFSELPHLVRMQDMANPPFCRSSFFIGYFII